MSDTIQRRTFLTSSLAAGAAVTAPGLTHAADAPPANPREVYELRKYQLRRGPMPKRADDYFKDALLPAAARHGLGPVGVFNVTLGPDSPTAYVLLVHKSLESVATLGDKLAADEAYQKAAAPFLAAPPTDPSYVTLETQVMRAVDYMPKLEAPQKSGRIFELRIYRSHSEPAALKKVEMFGAGGELSIFRRVRLTPVLFAQTLAGTDMPNLTYLLTYPDMAARDKAWATFRPDPEWKKLSTTPGYTDAEIVAGITNLLLAPAPYSQI